MAEPTLRQLHYLVALSDHLHFGDAATACGVSQPNLSAQIQELERNLGVQLVERNPRRVLLTRAGSETVERARRIIRDMTDLVGSAGSQADPLTGRLNLGVIPTVAPYVLPRVLPSVRVAYPSMQLHLVEDFTERLLSRLDNGELDVALLALPVERANVESVVLANEPFVAIAPTSHPLARQRCVETARWNPDDILLLQEGHCLRDQTLAVCNMADGARRATVEGSSLNTLVQMVANGLGTTLVPLIALDVEVPAGGEIAVIPFGKPQPSRTIGLVWRTSSPHIGAYRALAELLRNGITELLDAKRSLVTH